MVTANRAVLRLPGDKVFAPNPVHSGGTVWQVAGDEPRGVYDALRKRYGLVMLTE